MNEAESPPTSFVLLHQATTVVLAFQVVFLLAQMFKDGGNSSSMTGVFAATLVLAAVNRRLSKDPQGRHAGSYIVAWRYAALALLGVITVIVAVDTYAPDTSLRGVPTLIAMLLPAVIALKGAALGKLKPGGVLGLRLVWTRESRLAWEKAHRLMGRILFFGGLIGLAAAPFVPIPATFTGIAALVLTGVIAGMFTSWRVWQADPERGIAR
jgi:uncharacterized membrane protein